MILYVGQGIQIMNNDTRIIELEEKIAYLQLGCDNLSKNRDEAMDRAKAKGERAAEIIKIYRTALSEIVKLAHRANNTTNRDLIDGMHNIIISIANDALAFRREERGVR